MSQNPYQSTQPSWATAADASVGERSAFIRNTYIHLVGAILLFAALCAIVHVAFEPQIAKLTATVTQGWMWLVFLGGFMGISYVADKWAHSNTSRSMQYAGLGVYVVAQVVFFMPLMYVAIHFTKDPHLLTSAGLMTLVVFGGLTAVVFLTKADFSFLRYALWIGGLAAMGLIIAACCGVPISLGFWFSAAMIVYAAGSVLYSTSNVLHHYNTSQHVAASLALFSSIALMLWYVIQLFMSFDE